MEQTSTAPPAPPTSRRKTGVIVLALILLLLAAGTYVFLRMAGRKAGAPLTGEAQNAAGPKDANTQASAGGPQGVQSAGTGLGGALAGGGAKGGEADAPKAPDNPVQGNQPVQQPAKPNGATTGTPATADAADAGQATNVGGLLGALTSSLGGPHHHDPVDFHTLEALLPSSLPGMQDAMPEGSADDTMSIKSTTAHVDFTGANDARIKLSITDATAISGLAGLANMPNPESSTQGDSYEKSEIISGRSVHEKWDATSKHGELSLSVGQRFEVEVVGDNVDMDALKNALSRIDLAKLESLKDSNPQGK